MKPKRIQRKRNKGWRMPLNTVSVCRPGKFGNPFKVGIDGTAEECVKLFEAETHIDFPNKLKFTETDVIKLKGKNLACFCSVGSPCHADVLLKIANPDF